MAGVDEVRAELLPEDKMRAIQEIKQSYGPVAMGAAGSNAAMATSLLVLFNALRLLRDK